MDVSKECQTTYILDSLCFIIDFLIAILVIRLVSNIKCLMMMGLVDMAWPAEARRGTSWKTFKSDE